MRIYAVAKRFNLSNTDLLRLLVQRWPDLLVKFL